MINCRKCRYAYNFKKGAELIDTFVTLKDINKFIVNILNDKFKVIADFSLKDLKSNKNFKKLDAHLKEQVLSIYNLTSNNISNKGLFVCSNCNFTEFINSNVILLEDKFTKSTRKNQTYNSVLRCNDKTLPRTKDYICPNKECASHTDFTNKEAVFYRDKATMNLTYMCCSCKQYWNIS